jgi:hypothetical protein
MENTKQHKTQVVFSITALEAIYWQLKHKYSAWTGGLFSNEIWRGNVWFREIWCGNLWFCSVTARFWNDLLSKCYRVITTCYHIISNRLAKQRRYRMTSILFVRITSKWTTSTSWMFAYDETQLKYYKYVTYFTDFTDYELISYDSLSCIFFF